MGVSGFRAQPFWQVPFSRPLLRCYNLSKRWFTCLIVDIAPTEIRADPKSVKKVRKFDADLDHEEDGDLAAAVEPLTRRQRRGDLRKKSLLKTMPSEAADGMVDKGEREMVSKCVPPPRH